MLVGFAQNSTGLQKVPRSLPRCLTREPALGRGKRGPRRPSMDNYGFLLMYHLFELGTRAAEPLSYANSCAGAKNTTSRLPQ